jgi:type II secretory pathway component GspD/PulD (secretin)
MRRLFLFLPALVVAWYLASSGQEHPGAPPGAPPGAQAPEKSVQPRVAVNPEQVEEPVPERTDVRSAPVAGEESMVIQLRYVSAEELGPILEEVLRPLFCIRFSGNRAVDEARAREAQLRERAAVPRIVLRTATNSLVLIGTREQLSGACDMIRRLDVW